jgi:ferric-dicitrate binding protein FerR (iron transport regulator)
MPRSDPKQEAAAWFATLSRLPISRAELWDFQAWRRKPANKAAYLEVERAELRRRSRFAPQPDPERFSVIDRLTGEPATFAHVQRALGERPRGLTAG